MGKGPVIQDILNGSADGKTMAEHLSQDKEVVMPVFTCQERALGTHL